MKWKGSVNVMNSVTMKLQADPLILQALQEDITSEDVTTNAILPKDCQGEAELLCKQDGIIAGLDVFARAFTLLDDKVWFEFFTKDGDEVHKGQKLAKVVGSMQAILSAERVGLNLYPSGRIPAGRNWDYPRRYAQDDAEYAGL